MNLHVRAAAMTTLVVGLNACVPWTVRPIDDAKESNSGPVAVSPAAYVDGLWNSKLLPTVLSSAVDARLLLDALAKSPVEAQKTYGHQQTNGPLYFIVKGKGVVTDLDLQSRSGLALVDVAPFDGQPELTIQIGPVLRGTSLRDATGLIRFTDFVNQLEFADAGNELNDRVLKNVLGPLDRTRLKGRTVSFAGTVAAGTISRPNEPRLRELVPVKLDVEASH